ncbi:MAG TPA: hypothetical protein VGI79_01450 [Caulobacteraceae bacterium]|jgi:hypothetical protein
MAGALLVAASVAACGPYDRAERARAAEIEKLSHQTFAQAAEPGRCVGDCDRQEAGFAYARREALTQADDCLGKGDEDFVEGCRQYAEDIDEAYENGLRR